MRPPRSPLVKAQTCSSSPSSSNPEPSSPSPLRRTSWPRPGDKLSGVCLPFLTFVAFPLDSGDGAAARREAHRLAPELWADGLGLATVLALEEAKRRGVAGAREAVADVNQRGPRSKVVEAIVWRLAEQMVEDIRGRPAVLAE